MKLTDLQAEQVQLIVDLYQMDLKREAIKQRINNVAHLLAGAEIEKPSPAEKETAESSA